MDHFSKTSQIYQRIFTTKGDNFVSICTLCSLFKQPAASATNYSSQNCLSQKSLLTVQDCTSPLSFHDLKFFILICVIIFNPLIDSGDTLGFILTDNVNVDAVAHKRVCKCSQPLSIANKIVVFLLRLVDMQAQLQ